MSWWHWFWVHVSQETGTASSASRSYNFWSGFGSDIGELALIGGLVTIVRHMNCHEHGCWRIGKHTTTEGYKLCRRHVARPKAHLNLHPIHPDHT